MTKWLPRIVFWGWNSLFILFIGMLLLTGVAPAIFLATATGDIPLSYAFSILLLIVFPIFTVIFALKKKAHDNSFLMKLFFGVELPIFLIALIRLFVLRQMTYGTTLLLLSILVACAYFLWSLYDEQFEVRGRLSAIAHAIPSTLMLVLGIGAALFLALYVPPFVVIFSKAIWRLGVEFFSFGWLTSIEAILASGYFLLIMMVFLILFVFSGVVFILAPIFMTKYYSQAWMRVKALAAPYLGGLLFIVMTVVVGAVWVSGYAATGRHQEAFTMAWLQEQESLVNVRADIEARREDVRRDLLNAYLFRYRYLQTRDDTDGIARLYQEELKAPSSLVNAAQSLHRLILSPLLYAGKANDDSRAGKLYQEIFDAPIQDAERDAIKKALKATWNRDQAQAGLLNIDAKKVFIAEQNVSILETATHASVEIEEVYENKTFEQQEVYYYFSLPEDAAITGLWLGFGRDRSKHDTFIVAPRGAAQEVYEGEVRRRVDPALLEQVGPRQYRLRAFPVPPKRARGTRLDSDQENERLRMRFTYDVPKTAKGIAAPRLLEKRNVFWTRKTKRVLDDLEVKEENWLPAMFAAETAPSENEETFILEQGYKVTRKASINDSEPKTVAILVDTSWSMHSYAEVLNRQLSDLRNDPTLEADVFLIGGNGVPSSKSRIERFPEEQEVSFFGSLSAPRILSEFEKMKGDRAYDAIMIVTDQGRYVADDGFNEGDISAPLWFAHLGLLAYAYDDAVLDTLYRTGGGVATSINEAVQGIRATAAGSRLSGGHAWTVEKIDIVRDEATPQPANSVAARQVALSLTRNAKTDLETLDTIHALAVAHDIVTPWSSMIVLVNERQRKALEEASDDADRFAREANTGEEDLTAPTLSGVPEPHEWMLLIISVLLLLFLWRRESAARAEIFGN